MFTYYITTFLRKYFEKAEKYFEKADDVLKKRSRAFICGMMVGKLFNLPLENRLYLQHKAMT